MNTWAIFLVLMIEDVSSLGRCCRATLCPTARGNDCSYIYAVAAALFILGAVNPLPNMDLLVSPGNQDGSRVPRWMFQCFFLLLFFTFSGMLNLGQLRCVGGMSMIIFTYAILCPLYVYFRPTPRKANMSEKCYLEGQIFSFQSSIHPGPDWGEGSHLHPAPATAPSRWNGGPAL